MNTLRKLPGIDRLWFFLSLATGITWGVADSGRSGMAIVLFVFALAVVKGAVVILDFMELRHAPALWRRVVLGWLLVVVAGILFAYLK